MSLKVSIAHDFTCPWCWIGLIQAERLMKELDVNIEWRAYELWPDTLPWPEATVTVPPPVNRPSTPTRLEFLLQMEGIEIPKIVKPYHMRTRPAHLAMEFAKHTKKETHLVKALYQAFWERGEDISNLEVLKGLAGPLGIDPRAMEQAINAQVGVEQIVEFDDPAYSTGVYNVPTFFIGDQRLAEQPYAVLEAAVKRQLSKSNPGPYPELSFPPAPSNRPYTVVNMVTTIDGKTVSGSLTEPVLDLGSSVDHDVMKQLESQVDAVLVGASTLRATLHSWRPATAHRIVLTRSGDLDFTHAFFSGRGSYVATTSSRTISPPSSVSILRAGNEALDLGALLERFKAMGIERLLILGGSQTNGLFLASDLVDELFMTVAPKIKLGDNLPTYANGHAFPKGKLPNFELLSHQSVGDELFLRYRRGSQR